MDIFSAIGCGCLYLTLGAGVHAGGFDDFTHKDFYTHAAIPLRTPLGRVEFGYEFENGVILRFDHTSQIFVRDTGLNMLLLEKRFNLTRRRGGG